MPVWLFHRRSSWTGLWYLRRHQHPYRGAEAFPYGPSVLQTIGRPQLQAIDKVVHVHIVQVVQSTGAVRVGSLHRLCCLEWHIGVDSRRFPVVQLVLVFRETLQSVEIPQAQFWDKVFMPVVQSLAQFLDKVFMPGVGQRLALMVQTVLKPVQFLDKC